ncbi:LamG domain-containing protein [Botrimarina mediterranea]|uniref:LamG domain-containing protein n=1 Tax=Botrimarina mediterranea TaxID=2528022 RepID=UPI001189298B|nr:hypothetical protein K2D_21120 [Planctomycetes bacterium K2D]
MNVNLRRVLATAAMCAVAPASLAATIAHWDFETDLIAGSAAPGQTVSHPSANGAFDAAIADLSGNGNELSAFTGAGGFAEMRFSGNVAPNAQTGSTLSVTGITDESTGASVCCEVLSTDGDLDFGGSPVGELAAWTIEASVNFADAGGWQTVVGKDGVGQATNGDLNQAPLYFQKMGDGTERFRINYVDVLGNVHTAFSTTTAVADEWYHLAATNDGSTMKIFVNGVEEHAVDLTTSADTRMVALDEAGLAGADPYGWSIARGMYNNGHGDRVNGYVDDVRISNVALSPGQLLFVPEPTAAALVLLASVLSVGSRRS